MAEQIREVDLNDWFKKSFHAYGMSVIKERALPDVRDGLKPVHRAILYEALRLGIVSKVKPTKVARIAGNVIGNWHPHGDIAVQDALVGLSEPWSNTLPIIEIKGNGGSVFGDPAAAGRYIEARLTDVGDAYGYKLKEGIVPYEDNFDSTGRMPTILPAKLPYLLINGIREGIAVGVAATIPPHNAREVIDMLIYFLEHKGCSIEDLLTIMPGPDFPTKATILNKDDMKNIYETGIGKVRVRATLTYDKKEHALHVVEIPYTFAGSMDNLVAELIQAATESYDAKKRKIPPKVPGIKNVSNYSGKAGIDICIELNRGVDPEEMKKTLFAKTRLETTVKFQFNALNEKELHTYSLKEYLTEFVKFQHEILINEYTMEKAALSHKMEIIKARLLAISFLDEIIDVVKHANGRKELMEVLMTGKILEGTNPVYHKTVGAFAFTEEQAEAVSGMPLYQLNRLDKEQLMKDGKEIQTKLKTAERLITDKAVRKRTIIAGLKTERKKFADTERKTPIINEAASVASNVELPPVPLYVAMDQYGYVRIEGKPFENACATTSKCRVGFFDRSGNCWNLFLDKVKETTGRGTLVDRLIDVPASEIVGFVTGIETEGTKSLFIYETGAVKQMELSKLHTKSRATKVSSRTQDTILKQIVLIPEGAVSVKIDDYAKSLSQIPVQGLSGTGKCLVSPKEDLYQITFSEERVEEESDTETKGIVTFTSDGKALFDWTGNGNLTGLFTIRYEDLLKTKLLFVHTNGTAKWVEGWEFAVKTKRSQIAADKEGLTSLYIGTWEQGTMIGLYEEGVSKRIDVTKISTQGKVGGGVRVFYTDRYTLKEVHPGDDSDLSIVSFAALPK